MVGEPYNLQGTRYELVSEDKMWDTLKAMRASGFHGNVGVDPDGNWLLELHRGVDNTKSITDIHIGDTVSRVGPDENPIAWKESGNASA